MPNRYRYYNVNTQGNPMVRPSKAKKSREGEMHDFLSTWLGILLYPREIW